MEDQEAREAVESGGPEGKEASPGCPKCGKPLRDVRVEVWPGFRCYKCEGEMEIVAMFVKGFDYISFIPRSIIPIAADLGVTLLYTHSPKIRHTYPMQVCPHCERKQGEWYTTKERDGRLIEEYKKPVREQQFNWCEVCDVWFRKREGSQSLGCPVEPPPPLRKKRRKK